MYTEARLRSWGLNIRGGVENLDFTSINMLSKDWGQGCAAQRVAIDDETWESELIVQEIHKESRRAGLMLRAVYMGHGRFAEERRKLAEIYLRRKLSRYMFWQIFDDAFARALDFYTFIAKTS
jgi:hypothetical protein